MNLPSDASSLVVPIHLNAWVVDSQNQEGHAWYYADFNNLSKFESVLPEAFDTSDESKPEVGIHLYWALPDALTHGEQSPDGKQFTFPCVPNRWLVVRFNTTKDNKWQAKLWVVQSDYIGSTAGSTANALSGSDVTSVAITTGSAIAINAGMALEIIDPDGSSPAVVITAAAVKQGDTQITIQPFTFTTALAAGSTVQLAATSSFLHPFQPTTMVVAPNQSTQFNIQNVNIGNHFSIEAWEAIADPGGELFLTAVGPGNISFSAYVPGIKDIFSFTDTELPPEGTGKYYFSYMVVGWYSDSVDGDPLRGVTSYVPGIWKSQSDWQNQTPAERLQTLLSYFKWSVNGTVGSSVPSTSLYHAAIMDVQWPPPVTKDLPQDTQVAVANTSIDAMAALIQAQAKYQADQDPVHQTAWIAAGNTLAGLMQASMYDLLNDYGKPGSSALMQQKIQQAWYGSDPGGIVWNVVSTVPQSSDQSATGLSLTPAQTAALNTQLAALNQSQRNLDQAQQLLESLQASLYMMWMKVAVGNSYGGWTNLPPTTIPDWQYLFPFIQNTIYPTLFNQVWDQYCAVNKAKALLPSPTDEAAANQWANGQWKFPDDKGGGTLTLTELGLLLKASTAPRFWHPNDPVLMVSGAGRTQMHGEDGRFNKDGTLTCRLPGQTITGVQVAAQPAITVQSMTSAGVNLNPFGPYASIPSIPSLVTEAFFSDPLNSPIMASAIGGNAAAINQAITSLFAQNAGQNSWIGTPPAPFALTEWEQAWSPLFLEWELHYYPTGSGSDASHQFSLGDWSFDGQKYNWQGTGFDPNYFVPYKGRTTLTPQTALIFKDKIQNYLKNHSDVDTQQMEALLSTISSWDLLSQTISGLTGQLATYLSQETFPPTPSNDMSVQCPRQGATPPSVTALIGEEYHHMPMLQGSGSDENYFYPVRGGFVQFQNLQIVDAYGQTMPLSGPNTGQGFMPVIGQDLLPSNPSSDPNQPLPYGSIQLAPRIVQSTKLDIKILSNDDSGKDILSSGNPNPVCGWLLPNHLDGGISVYDSGGILLGELLPLAPPDNWRPRPGAPGENPPPATPADIPNTVLKNVVTSIWQQSAPVFKDLLKVIDETLWMVDPMGGRRDQYLSVLIGRPLAIVQMQFQLDLLGDPIYNQLWNNMATADESNPPNLTWTKQIGEVENISFPVRLGSLELRNDGLLGYFLTQGTDSYSTFYSVHTSPEVPGSDTYIKPIVNNGEYQGDISLQNQGASVTVAMLMDPRGVLHAYTGILPVTKAELPAHLIEDFIRTMKVTFQTGPIIADPGTLRTPKPAEQHGMWYWIQAVPSPTNWEQDTIVDADDNARMPDAQLVLREGWLQLSDVKNANSKSSS